MSIQHLLVCAVALLDKENNVLLAQRPAGKDMAGLWEFPGGKVHADESPETALVREIKEELSLLLKEADLVPLTFASHCYEKFYLVMPLFVCHTWEGEIMPMEGQSFEWVPTRDLANYAMPPADMPLVEALKSYITAKQSV